MRRELGEIEKLVRAGHLAEAKRLLTGINLTRIPRADLLAFASLSRRIGRGQLALKMLGPIVRSEFDRKSVGVHATPEEKIEYAATLRMEGAQIEAAEILATIDSVQFPQAGFQLALCAISQWDYAGAIPFLRAYIQTFQSPVYAKYVAQINLLSAYIHEHLQADASRLLVELRAELKSAGLSLLYQRSCELGAQLAINGRDWDQAHSYLKEGDELLSHAKGSMYSLLLRKWVAIANTLKSAKVTPELRAIRNEAKNQKVWEIVRDCDYYIGTVSGDSQILSHLYFGTPFASYRKKLLGLIGDVPARFLWGDPAAQDVLDLTLGRIAGGAELTAGQALHRFLVILCQDFYKPIPALTVFSKLFPQERFNPFTSPNRVRQISSRFGKWLEDNSLPLDLTGFSSEYRLVFTGPVAIEIPRTPLPLDQNGLEFRRLTALLDTKEFTAKQAAQASGTSRSSMQRLLKWAMDEGHIELEGHTDRAHYKRVS